MQQIFEMKNMNIITGQLTIKRLKLPFKVSAALQIGLRNKHIIYPMRTWGGMAVTYSILEKTDQHKQVFGKSRQMPWITNQMDCPKLSTITADDDVTLAKLERENKYLAC